MATTYANHPADLPATEEPHRDPEEHAAWLAFLQKERDLRQRASALANASDDEKRDALRRWWESVEHLLGAAVRQIGRQGSVLSPQPVELLTCFQYLASMLAVGNVPEVFTDVAERGRTVPAGIERRDIGLAVAYHRACQRDGLEHRGEVIKVLDRAPSKTLAQWYGVTRRSIQEWVKTIEVPSLGETPVTAEVLIRLVRDAGMQYQRSGRSQKAIGSRPGAKNRKYFAAHARDENPR